MSGIDADDEIYDYDFNPEDLEITAAYEEQLIATQALPEQSSSFYASTNRQESLFPNLNTTQQMEPSHSNINSSQQRRERLIDDNTFRIIEELKQKLYITEHQNKVLENKLRDTQEIIKNKACYLSVSTYNWPNILNIGIRES